MTKVLDEVYAKTGFVGMAMFAGPEPSQAGNICLLEYAFKYYLRGDAHGTCVNRFHKGRTSLGHDFGLAYKDYEAHVRKPFHKFVSGMYRESVLCWVWASG